MSFITLWRTLSYYYLYYFKCVCFDQHSNSQITRQLQIHFTKDKWQSETQIILLETVAVSKFSGCIHRRTQSTKAVACKESWYPWLWRINPVNPWLPQERRPHFLAAFKGALTATQLVYKCRLRRKMPLNWRILSNPQTPDMLRACESLMRMNAFWLVWFVTPVQIPQKIKKQYMCIEIKKWNSVRFPCVLT